MLHCASCAKPIVERFLLKVLDRPWHAQCVQCCECQCALTDKCFSREGRLYCKDDFFRRFGTKCGGCAQGILPSDLVRRARSKVFHLNCFTCVMCHRQLSTGEELYVLDELKFICKDDYQNNKSKDTIVVSVSTCSDDPSMSPDSQDPRDDGKDSETGHLSDKDVTSHNEGGDEPSTGSKRRGPRTTIKAKQLETLKAAFAATPKPTRHIREQLSQDTGLNMRVIQVWFQNRRSKERRMKQLSALSVRRHVLFRGHRRMRGALGDRLDPAQLDHFSYYAEYPGEYYGSGSYEYFPGPPSSQAQTPADLGFAPSSIPAGTPLGAHHHHHHHHQGRHCPGEVQCFSDSVSHHATDSPSPDPSGPGSMHSLSSEAFTGTPTDSGYPNQLSHTSPDLSEGTVW